MSALYAITNEYIALAERLADLDLDVETVKDTIEASGLMDSLQDKAQGLEYVARGALAHHFAIDSEIARLQALKLKRDKVAQGLRDYLKDNMIRAGILKIECSMFSISVRDNPPATEVFDLVSLPAEYWRTPVVKPPAPAPDKAAIKEAIQAGIEVTGARLTQGTRLEVR
jgi:hypothetical protein